MNRYLAELRKNQKPETANLQNLQNPGMDSFVGFVGTPDEAFKTQPETQKVLCLACQHYRFGHDHMGNVARCMASGGFRGVLIERPEQRRECIDYVLYDDPDRT